MRESQLQNEKKSRNVMDDIWNSQGFPIVSGRQQALNIRNDEANNDIEMLLKDNINTRDQAVIDKLLA